MKKALSIVFTLLVCYSFAQPNRPGRIINFQPFGKSILSSGKKIVDGKYIYYDSANYIQRPFKDTSEVRICWPWNQRGEGQTFIVNSGGTLLSNGEILGGVNYEWWYKDTTSNAGLVRKNELAAQTGNSGKFLRTNGVSTYWDTLSGGGVSYTASNGVNRIGSDFRLGGNLSQNTTLKGLNTYNLDFDSIGIYRVKAVRVQNVISDSFVVNSPLMRYRYHDVANGEKKVFQNMGIDSIETEVRSNDDAFTSIRISPFGGFQIKTKPSGIDSSLLQFYSKYLNINNAALGFNHSYGSAGQVLTSNGITLTPTWTTISGGDWGLTGNVSTTAGTNFIGTTDDVDLVFKRNNIESGRIGRNNTFIGNNAGNGNTGIRNIIIGSQPSAPAQSGNSNTFIGDGTALNHTSGDGNIYLGNRSGRYATTQSNELFINSFDRSSRNADTTLSLVYGQMATSIAAQRLRINGTLQIVDGTQGLNKVLISDANGVGSWQTPSGGGGSSAFGSITGLINDQTNLRDSLRARLSLYAPYPTFQILNSNLNLTGDFKLNESPFYVTTFGSYSTSFTQLGNSGFSKQPFLFPANATGLLSRRVISYRDIDSFPSYVGQTNKYLKYNGSALVWDAVAGGGSDFYSADGSMPSNRTVNGNLKNLYLGSGIDSMGNFNLMSLNTNHGFSINDGEGGTIATNGKNWGLTGLGHVQLSGVDSFSVNSNKIRFNNKIFIPAVRSPFDTLATLNDVRNNWGLTGNIGTVAGTNFIGTTDDVDLVFKRNGIQTGRLGTTNLIFGFGSGLSNSGTHNSFFGALAGLGNTSGVFNTYIGKSAGYSSTTGSTNVFIGASSGYGNSTGTSNTFIGENSSFGNTVGNNSISIGAYSGSSNATSNQLYINSINRSTLTGDTTLSILYGYQAATIANQKLRVNGSLQVNDGTQGLNKVFTSDANGVGSWQTPSGIWGGITGILSNQTDLQTALNAKLNTVSPSYTGTMTTPLTASRLAIIGGSNELTTSAVTTTEAGFLSGVTSAIQTQFSAKQNALTLTTTGSSGAATLVGATLNIPNYAGGGSSQWTTSGTNIYYNTGNVGIGSTATPIGTLTITKTNDDYTNTGGAGTHLLLENPNASGQTVIMARHNGVIKSKIRTDDNSSLNLLSYANSNGTGINFNINGDYPTGSTKMKITNTGVIFGASLVAEVPGQVVDVRGNIVVSGNAALGTAVISGNAQMATASIGVASPVASAKLEVVSTTQGFLTSRMTVTQRDAIASPATGLEIYNTTTNRKNVFNGVNWPDFLVSSAATLTLKHNGDYIFNGTTATWTLPAINAGLVARENSITIKNRGSGVITLNTAAGSTLYTNMAVATLAINAGEAYTLMPDGTFFNVQ